MNRSKSSIKFVLASALALCLTALITVLAAPGIGSYFRSQSDRLATEARAAEPSDPHKAAVRYQMAAFLNPGNHAILKSLADMYIRLDQPDSAIAALRQLPLREEGIAIADLQMRSNQLSAALETLNEMINDRITEEVLVAKSRVLLEMDRGGEAATAASDATSYALNDTAAKLQLGLCQLILDDEAAYQTTIASLSGSEAARTLQNAHAYKLALARELYADGLLRTSERILSNLDTSATERYLLLAKIKLAQGDTTAAHDQLIRATKLDPANIEAHQMLEELLLKIGDDTGADEQVKLIKSLQGGLL